MFIPCDKSSTIIYELVTLTLPFDLLLKNFNLGHNFQTRRDRAFKLHIWYQFILIHWPWSLTYFWKIFNLCCHLLMVAIRQPSLPSDNSYYALGLRYLDHLSVCSSLFVSYSVQVTFKVQVFSSPEPKAQVSYCHSAPSVVRPSVRRRPSPSVNWSKK